METMEQKGWGKKSEWKINSKSRDDSINIGFGLPESVKLENVKLSKEELIRRKKLFLLGEVEIDEQSVHYGFMRKSHGNHLTNCIGAINRAQDHYNIHKDQFNTDAVF